MKRHLLDIERKDRVNLLPWRGQFSPQLVENLISQFGQKACRVADPFSGSGTVGYESLQVGKQFIGTELNVAAFMLSSIYSLSAISAEAREAAINDLRSHFLPYTNTAPTIADVKVDTDNPVDATLQKVVWMLTFKSSTTASAASVKRALEKVADIVLNRVPVGGSFELHLRDARSLPVEDRGVQLVVTSPPYINVLNYHEQYRPVVEALGYKPLKSAPSEVGSNRKNRQNRFLTVVQYCLDMAAALSEMSRACDNNGSVVMVVGRQSKVLGVPFYNGELIVELLRCCLNQEVSERYERAFKNRFGQTICEDVLVFRPSNNKLEIASARDVASFALKVANSTPNLAEQTSELICDAIEKARSVKPSPTYNQGEF